MKLCRFRYRYRSIFTPCYRYRVFPFLVFNMEIPVPKGSAVFVTGTIYSLRTVPVPQNLHTVPVPRNVYTRYRYILMFTFRYQYRFNFYSSTVISTGTYTSNTGSKSQYSRYSTGTIGIYIVPVPLNVYNLYRYRSMFTTCTGTVQCLQPVPVPFNIHTSLPIPGTV